MRFSRWLGIAVSIGIPVGVTRSQEPGTNVIPQALWAAQVDQMTLRFAWNAVPAARAYRISCAIGGMPEKILGTMPSSQLPTYANGVPRRTSYARPLPFVQPGTEYACSLEWGTATGRFYGKTAFNRVITASANGIRRDPPAFVVAKSTGEDEITVTWSPVRGATAYTINREVAPLGFSPFCDLCTTTSTSIVDRLTEKSRKHRYFVTPITPAGAALRATSNYVVPGATQDTTPIAPGTPLTPPAAVTAAIAGPTTARVSFLAVRGPLAYDITRYAAPGFKRMMRVRNDLAGVLIEVPDVVLKTGTSAAATVYYEVRSVGNDGKVTQPTTSNTIRVSAKDAAALSLATRNVTNARATAIAASSVMLTWTPPSGSYPCDLERSLSGLPFGLLSRVPGGAYRYVDEMPDLMARAPSYRIKCGAPGKLPLAGVAFPAPTPPG